MMVFIIDPIRADQSRSECPEFGINFMDTLFFFAQEFNADSNAGKYTA